MPHHGQDFDPELGELLRKLGAELREADPFPEGKLVPSDHGVQTFGVGVKGGKVVIQFASPTIWIGMGPGQAEELAAVLVRRAKEAREATG